MRYYQFIRLSKAHALLQQTDLSVTEIAVSAGFGSLEHFCRVYRRQFGRRPRDDRRQSISAPVLRRSEVKRTNAIDARMAESDPKPPSVTRNVAFHRKRSGP